MAPQDPLAPDSRDGASLQQESISMEDTEEHFCDTHPTMTELDPHEPVRRRSVYRRESFLVAFATSDGPPQIVILMLLLALGFGSTIGVVPAVMSDRYARLSHGYTDDKDCSSYGMDDKPAACLAGSADAQNAAALSNLISNGLTFITSSLMGSISDEHGRRGKIMPCATNYWFPSFLFLICSHSSPFRSPYSWHLLGDSVSSLSCSASN